MIRRIILVALLSLLWIVPPIASADDGLLILDEAVELDFPDRIIFHLEANSVVDIVDVRLHYQVIKRNYALVVSEGWPDFIPAESIKTGWEWDMRKSSLPPGVTIIYCWTVEDADGEYLQTVPRELNFDDLRYDWQIMSEGQIALYWYEGDDSFARELMEACQQGVIRLNREIGALPEKLIKIYVYSSANDLRGAMIYPQEWTGGAAFTEFDTIVIGISPDNVHWGTEALVHELTHLVVHQTVFSPYGQLPTWLDEGLAMYNEGALAPSFQSRLEEAVVANELISVRSLCSSFPADPDGAYLAYAESYSLAEYLLTNYGRDKMLSLLTLFKEGSNCDEALEQVYGFTIAGLDTHWRQTLIKPVVQVRRSRIHPGLIAVMSALATSLTLAAALALEERDWRRIHA
jgi:hypothetical protein